MTEASKITLQILKASLCPDERNHFDQELEVQAEDFLKIQSICREHKIDSLLLPVENQLPNGWKIQIDRAGQKAALQSYRLLLLTKFTVKLLWKAGIKSIVLKGPAVASLYEIPELRKSGDVDLLVPLNTDFDLVDSVFQEKGLRRLEEQRTLHHVEYVTEDGISIEVHKSLLEDTPDEEINEKLQNLIPEFFEHQQNISVMEMEIPSLEDGYHAFYLLLHMYQHYTRAGFGLKLLADWVVFWNREVSRENQEVFLRFVKDTNLLGFSRMVSLACIQYLGLEKEHLNFLLSGCNWKNESIEQFMEDTIKGGEFGRATTDRMVVLEKRGMIGLWKEFHHQMKLTYPEQAKHKLLWPILWVRMLVGFLIRNKTVRKTSLRKVLKSANSRTVVAEEMQKLNR